jgi:hypothetical protein
VVDLDSLGSATEYYLAPLALIGATLPVLEGQWRTYNLTVVATDIAGNVGGSSSRVWTLDRRVPITSLTVVPPPLSAARTGVVVNWLSDEDGTSRNITYRCSIDGALPTVCIRTAVG